MPWASPLLVVSTNKKSVSSPPWGFSACAFSDYGQWLSLVPQEYPVVARCYIRYISSSHEGSPSWLLGAGDVCPSKLGRQSYVFTIPSPIARISSLSPQWLQKKTAHRPSLSQGECLHPIDVSDDEWAFMAPYLTLMTEDAPSATIVGPDPTLVSPAAKSPPSRPLACLCVASYRVTGRRVGRSML
jgi:hypothetical protein